MPNSDDSVTNSSTSAMPLTEERAAMTPRPLLSEIGARLAQALRNLRGATSIREASKRSSKRASAKHRACHRKNVSCSAIF